MNLKIIISVLITIIIAILLLRSLNYLIEDVLYDSYKNDCEKVYHLTSDRNIVLRIDDIQANYLDNIQMKIINDALNRGKTLSLAVIPLNLEKDKKIFNFLKKNRCDVEIALHGYSNEDYEFLNLEYSEADKKIKDGLEVLNKIEPEVMTFIPPNNGLSAKSKIAVYSNGIKIISSGFQNREFGYSVSTFDWETNRFMNYMEVLSECEDELDRNETCIIMIHPQDYITNGKFDERKYEQYIYLLDNIDRLNATVVTFRDLYYRDIEKL